MREREWRGKRVVVFGLGFFGGQVAAIRHLAARGARIVVTDKKGPEELASALEALRGLELTFALGGHGGVDFEGAEVVVKSPAVPWSAPELAIAQGAGAEVVSELQLFLEGLERPWIAVTGSNGKSTTTALLGAFLGAEFGAEGVAVGGNIGRPLLEESERAARARWVVIETSSYMAEDLARAVARGARIPAPRGVVVTNLTPNHLDWHGSVEAYYEAKEGLFDLSGGAAWIVADGDDPEMRARWEARGDPRCRWVALAARPGLRAWMEGAEARAGARTLFPRSGLPLLGMHNVKNALLAAAAALEAGAAPASIAAGAARFTPLPHRLEVVGEDARGVRFVNDSIATTPESVAAALAAIEGPVLLLLGGHDKGLALAGLFPGLAARGRAAVLFGAAAARFEGELAGARGLDGPLQRVRAEGLREALVAASSLAAPGDTVLLSPSCASYDQFRNFEERGDRFREMARRLCRGERL